MIVYWDLVLALNFCFDFLLLLVVKIVLKRKRKLRWILLGALLGSLSIFFLFWPIPPGLLFLLKIVISMIMILCSFGFSSWQSFLRNLSYLYITSVLLGGFLYYLNMEFSYKQEGLLFFFKGYSVNYLFLLIIAPVILYIYIRQARELKFDYHEQEEVVVYFPCGKQLELQGFWDTGNKLEDPFSGKGIVLIEKEALKEIPITMPFYIPYRVLNHDSLLLCIKAIKVVIAGRENKRVVVGISESSFGIDGVRCLLGPKIKEGLK